VYVDVVFLGNLNDPDLIEVLSQLDINDEISPDLYIVAAELLAFVYSLNSVHP